MKIILEPEGKVKLEVKIEGIVDWSYNYHTKGGVEPFSGSSKESIDGITSSHELGEPSELTKITHNWDVKITNRSDADQTYSVVLKWIQNGETIFTWIPDEEMKVNAPSYKSHSDSANLYILDEK